MDIIQVNDCDLIGRKFNGHDLQLSLNELGQHSYQLVLEKLGNEKTTIPLCDTSGVFIQKNLKNLERELSMANLLYPFGKVLVEHPIFKTGDIIHYHFMHKYFISILDFANLTSLKPSVWTVHDPWIVTGHCIHPLECMEWKNGCLNCSKLDDSFFPMNIDKASEMWKIKKNAYEKMDMDIIVASQFMKDYVRNSPLTEHIKYIHKIPFGIDINRFKNSDRQKARKRWGISNTSFVIAFRADANEVKGLKYIIEMLDKFTTDINISVLTVGGESLPKYLTEKYHVIELGWQNDLNILYDFYAACNVFLMPSLAESFGMMAIEAMASRRPVIVFENTVLPEITFAPECGIAVPYKNSDMLKNAVERLMKNPDECKWRGEKGRALVEKYYKYEDYVNNHINLYKEILDRKGSCK